MRDPCPVGMRGIVPSLNTPFTADGAVDLDGVRRLVNWTVASGAAGMLLLAVAGEGQSLTRGEFRAIAETAVAQNARRVPVIVSVTAADPAERRWRAGLAAAIGADAMLCQPPAGPAGNGLGGDGLVGDELERVFAEIADVGPPLLMIQDLAWQGPGMAIADIVRLYERIPAFQCLKLETVPAGPKYTEVLKATGGRLHVSGGWALAQMIDALDRDVHAFMPTGLEPIWVAVYRLYRDGRVEAARALFERALPIVAFANQHIDVSIRFCKHLRREAGIFRTAICRSPVAPLDDFQQREAARLTLVAQRLIAELAE
jgi:dihydrodipicolinate synthase/N-acetylneuraminate lyase